MHWPLRHTKIALLTRRLFAGSWFVNPFYSPRHLAAKKRLPPFKCFLSKNIFVHHPRLKKKSEIPQHTRNQCHAYLNLSSPEKFEKQLWFAAPVKKQVDILRQSRGKVLYHGKRINFDTIDKRLFPSIELWDAGNKQTRSKTFCLKPKMTSKAAGHTYIRTCMRYFVSTFKWQWNVFRWRTLQAMQVAT